VCDKLLEKLSIFESQTNIYMKLSQIKPFIIFLIISFLLILCGFLVSNLSAAVDNDKFVFFGELFKNTGFTIFTVAAVSALWNLLGGDPVDQSIGKLDGTLSEFRSSVKLLEDSKENGLNRILATSSDFGSPRLWVERLKTAKRNIDLLGYTLIVWADGNKIEEELENLAKRGVKIRVLIMDENNPHLPAFLNTAQISAVTLKVVKEDIRNSYNFFTAIKESLAPEVQSNLEIRTLKMGLISMQLCRTDNRMTMVQYIYSLRASRSPMMEITNAESDMFKVYSNEFEKLWELSNLV